jgi:hypothetical protein
VAPSAFTGIDAADLEDDPDLLEQSYFPQSRSRSSSRHSFENRGEREEGGNGGSTQSKNREREEGENAGSTQPKGDDFGAREAGSEIQADEISRLCAELEAANQRFADLMQNSAAQSAPAPRDFQVENSSKSQ